MTKAEFEKLPQYLLDRVYLPDRTLSSLISPQAGIIAKTLELPWRDNARSISCIPEDEYLVIYSGPVLKDDPTTEVDESGGRIPRPYAHYIVLDYTGKSVTGRSGILIHAGIDVNHSLGCIIVGGRFVNYNTAQPKLAESRAKLDWMTTNLPKRFRLLIGARSGVPYT
jgi:hypothetical protein